MIANGWLIIYYYIFSFVQVVIWVKLFDHVDVVNKSDNVVIIGANVVVVVVVVNAAAVAFLIAQDGNSLNSGYTTAPQLFN